MFTGAETRGVAELIKFLLTDYCKCMHLHHSPPHPPPPPPTRLGWFLLWMKALIPFIVH